MMRNSLLLFILLIIKSASAQYTFVKQWDARFGGIGNDWIDCIVSCEDGGFLLCGDSDSPLGGDKSENSRGWDDYWVVKIDSSGNKEWDHRFGAAGDDWLKSAIQTGDGGFLLGGCSGSGANGDKTQSGRGDLDYWIVKINSAGVKEWDRRYGGSREEFWPDIAKTRDGGYIMGGRSTSGISGDRTQPNWNTWFVPTCDYWIVKTDSLGQYEWDKRYGGNKDDDLRSIIQTSDGGYLLGGFSSSDSSGDRTQFNWNIDTNIMIPDYWVVKIDSVGNKEWDKRFGTKTGDRLHQVLDLNGEEYMLVGHASRGMEGDKDIDVGNFWIIIIDSLGLKKQELGFNAGAGYANMSRTSDGGYLLSGEATNEKILLDTVDFARSEKCLGGNQSWILKLDSLGIKQWDKTIFSLGSDDAGYAIQTKDGCYAVANSTRAGIGGYQTNPNRDGGKDSTFDYWVVKFCMEPYNAVEYLSEEERKVLVYPNPFSSDVSIAIEKEDVSEAIFTIINSIGQIIYHRKETGLGRHYTKNLDLSYLPNGAYFIQVEMNGESVVRRVMKE